MKNTVCFRVGMTGLLLLALLPNMPDAVRGESTNVLQLVDEASRLLRENGLKADPVLAVRPLLKSMVLQADLGGMLMTEAEKEQHVLRNQGYVSTVGILVENTNTYPAIARILDDSVKDNPLLACGRQLRWIDASSARYVDPATCQDLLTGPTNSMATLITADSAGQTLTGKVNRVFQPMPALISAERMHRNIGYIKLRGLYGDAAEKATSSLKQWDAMPEHIGAVLDLRGAGGTDLAAVRSIAGLFCDCGTLLYSLRANGKDAPAQDVKSETDAQVNHPLMVLIDSNTHSAAEVLAACLKDSCRGTLLLGEVSKADPCLRAFISLSSGDWLYIATRTLTTAKTTYQGLQGVTPDLEVAENRYENYKPAKRSGKDKEAEEDKRLRRRIKNDKDLARAVDIIQGLNALNLHK